MENKNGRSKKNVGGVLLDILTIGMLFASFAALFYSGFILQTDTFPIGALCAITAVGLLLLFFIGDVSCLASKVKNHSLTAGFLAFSALQLIALIVNLALLLAIMVKLFSVEDFSARLTYVISTAVVLIGYVASISYFSDGSVGDDTAEEDEEESEEEADDDAAAENEQEAQELAEDDAGAQELAEDDAGAQELAEEDADAQELVEEVSDADELVEEVSDAQELVEEEK